MPVSAHLCEEGKVAIINDDTESADENEKEKLISQVFGGEEAAVLKSPGSSPLMPVPTNVDQLLTVVERDTVTGPTTTPPI